MSTYLRDDVTYRCPQCDGTDLSVSMFCWVDVNATDGEARHCQVDLESDVGDMDHWFCNTCDATLTDFPTEEEQTCRTSSSKSS